MKREDLEKIEAYIEGTLGSVETKAFEEQMQKESWLMEAVREHKSFVSHLNQYKQRRKLKDKLEQYHNELGPVKPEEPVKQKSLWSRHWTTMAVAASVALITASTFLFSWDAVRPGKNKQFAYYKELKREVEKIKSNQNVILNLMGEEENAPSFGATAFAVSTNGLLATSYHSIKNADSLTVENRKYGRLKVTVAFYDEKYDIAVLKIVDKRFKKFKSVPFKFSSRPIQLSEKVFTLGFPRSDLVYGEGPVASLTGYEGEKMMIQVAVPVNPGNSGSPLFNERGEISGMITGKHLKEEGASFAIKAEAIVNVLKNEVRPNQLNLIGRQPRPMQVKKAEDFIFELKVY